MACKYICDECAKEAEGEFGMCDWSKPHHWYIRRYVDRLQIACSEKCVEKLKEKFPEKERDGE